MADPATIARFCIAPVVPTCGVGASVSQADCAAATDYCTSRELAPPLCRAESRSDEAWRRGFVSNPHASRPLTYPRGPGGPDECDEVGGCDMCQGDCDDDSDCRGSLRCFKRDNLALSPPGCSRQLDMTVDDDDDFCFDPIYQHPDMITVSPMRSCFCLALSCRAKCCRRSTPRSGST